MRKRYFVIRDGGFPRVAMKLANGDTRLFAWYTDWKMANADARKRNEQYERGLRRRTKAKRLNAERERKSIP